MLVGRVADVVERALGSGVHSDRVAGADSSEAALSFEPWRKARRGLYRHFEEAVSVRNAGRTVLARADVRNCFPSIQPVAVERALRALEARKRDVADLRGLLERFVEQGVPGLPVGPSPSAVLASAVLAASDRALRTSGVDVLRWVDDYVVLAPNEREARRALQRLRASLAEAGLQVAEHKTGLGSPGTQIGMGLSCSDATAFGLESGG
jgi:nucleotide-binding universal stress UspA family protein